MRVLTHSETPVEWINLNSVDYPLDFLVDIQNLLYIQTNLNI